jgi:predicted XRE-type DNA-binding protein
MDFEYLEEWLPIRGYEGLYEVSNAGRVRRVAGFEKHKKIKGRLLTACLDGKYLNLSLFKEGKKRSYNVHKLVAEAFIGPCPFGKEADHKDGNKLNNFASNLQYLRHNVHQQKHGKLTKEQVLEIRRLYTEGFTQQQISDQFGIIQRQHVSDIVNRKTWKNV